MTYYMENVADCSGYDNRTYIYCGIFMWRKAIKLKV